MRPPAYLIKQGVSELPCIGDGRQSGTSGSPSILNAFARGRRWRGSGIVAFRRPGAYRSKQLHRGYFISDDELKPGKKDCRKKVVTLS